MKVTVRLVSIGSGDAGERILDIADATCLADIPALVGLAREESLAMLVNNMPVAPDARASHTLVDGDLITVFPPIKGG